MQEKRNIAFNRTAFEEGRQGPHETFDDFYVRLVRLADLSEICTTCRNVSLVTHIMVDVWDPSIKKKLLGKSPFSSEQEARTICRSEKAADANERVLGEQAVSAGAVEVTGQPPGCPPSKKGPRCDSCNSFKPHTEGETCFTFGKKCHYCRLPDHHAPYCPAKARGEP